MGDPYRTKIWCGVDILDMFELEKRLAKLREEYKKTADPTMRRVLEARAKLLRLALYNEQHKNKI